LLIQQGKNIDGDEFQALGNQFTSTKWNLPEVCEFKDDIPMPVFKSITASQEDPIPTPQIKDGPPPENSPVSETQWVKVQKMVA
jgi:hypothetical protein